MTLRDSDQKSKSGDPHRDAPSCRPQPRFGVPRVELAGRALAIVRPPPTCMKCCVATTRDKLAETRSKSKCVLRLIDWLEEDSLDYRVLAVHDLGEITEKKLMP